MAQQFQASATTYFHLLDDPIKVEYKEAESNREGYYIMTLGDWTTFVSFLTPGKLVELRDAIEQKMAEVEEGRVEPEQVEAEAEGVEAQS